ncbi:MAG: PH domain-containing protein [Verrucomicrobia bacterium]|nr:PH domain-containing protein [Verrucomicrobiota bacterium]
MLNEKIILRATFNPKVKTYWVISSTLVFVTSIVGIPLLIIWLPLAYVFAERYLQSLECVLTDRAVKLKSGVWNKVEKTIPLDKVTDLGLAQAPIMRALDIERVSVETAGSSSPGALASVIGINNGRAFRDAVLQQKELLGASQHQHLRDTGAATVAPAGQNEEQTQLLREIRDCLWRIEQRSAGQ